MSGSIIPNPTSGMDWVPVDSGVLIEGFYVDMMALTNFEGFLDLFHTAMDGDGYLGLTRGGSTFSLEAEERIMEYDGRRVRSIGDSTFDSANPQIATTLLVHNPANKHRLLPRPVTTFDDIRYSVRTRLGTPTAEDHMEDLCWIREMKGGGYKIDVLFNARMTGGYEQTGSDMSESEMPAVFTGFARTWDDTAFAPAEEVIFPHPSQIAALTGGA